MGPGIGRYAIVRELARGGMGAVLHGRSPEGRDVAIKVVLDRSARDALARFERERRLLASLGEAEGFVPILDAGEDRSGPFLVMPLITGGTLRDRLERGPLAVDDALALAQTLSAAIGRAHAKGIVHRDLKPENILFTADGRPLIADLGLAKHFRRDVDGGSQSVALSKTGEFKGTLGYMAPEQTGRAREAGPPADVFALAAILYECLTGEAPFEGATASEVLAKVASDRVPAVRRKRPDAPRWVNRTIQRALRRDPERRYADGAAFAQALADGPAVDLKARLLTGAVALGAVGVIALGGVVLLQVSRSSRANATQAEPSPDPGATPHASPTPKRPAHSSTEPAWFDALPEAARPRLPLPKGIAFTNEPGVYKNASDGSELVYVVGGPFRMGSESDESQRAHDVTLSPWFMGRYEVTVAQYDKFEQATGYKTLAEQAGEGTAAFGYDSNPENMTVPGGSFRAPTARDKAGPTEPATQLAWPDAEAYCKWAGLTLPSEAQWEYAASWDAAKKLPRRFPWGEKQPENEYAANKKRRANLLDETFRKKFPMLLSFYEGYDDGFLYAAPVGSFPEGIAPSGCHDMAGNAREWCLDFYDAAFYRGSPTNDPVAGPPRDVAGLAVSMHVIRGSSFASSTQYAPMYYRAQGATEFRAWDLGFRVARPAW